MSQQQLIVPFVFDTLVKFGRFFFIKGLVSHNLHCDTCLLYKEVGEHKKNLS